MKLVKSFALIFIITVMIVSFQNCTIKQNTGLLSSTSNPEEEKEAVVSNAPFAYDHVVDTISYNSCVGTGLTAQGIHGLKIGVNEGFIDNSGNGAVNAGVKLRTEFLQFIGKNVSPIFPSTVITPAQIQHILKNSPINKEAFIQYAVRKRSDLTLAVDIIQPTPTTAISLGRDGFYELAPLDQDPVLTYITKNVQYGPGGSILAEGPRAYNLFGVSDPRPMEVAFSFSANSDESFPPVATADDGTGAGEQYSDLIRKRFTSNGPDKIVLTTTFGSPNKITTGAINDVGFNSPKRANETDKTKAFGRSFELKFESLSTKAGWRNNLLKSVSELNLAKGDTTGAGTWSCENFVIMKKIQFNNPKFDDAACVPLITDDLNNVNFAAQIKRIRRHYSEANWNIGLFYGKNVPYVATAVDRATHPICLVPKQTECYLQTAGLTADGTDIGVQYDPNQECYLSRFTQMGVGYTGSLTGDPARKLGRCAQFASICVRQ